MGTLNPPETPKRQLHRSRPRVRRPFGVRFAAALAVLAVFPAAFARAPLPPASRTAGTQVRAGAVVARSTPRPAIAAAYGHLELAFERNRGQLAGPATFFAIGPGYRLDLLPGTAQLELWRPGTASVPLRLELVGGNPRATVSPSGVLPGHGFYYVGRSHWQGAVSRYARVTYSAVYPGVDLAYYGRAGRLEYDFLVAPGADTGRIRMAFRGTTAARLDAAGDVVLTTPAGEVLLRRPIAYQVTRGARRPVAVDYFLRGGAVALAFGSYDHSRPLVIDPSLQFATYVGSYPNDQVNGIAVASDGSQYIIGTTPTPDGTEDPSQAFVAHVAADGSHLLYLTYLGGNAATVGNAIALDAAGDAYITGQTSASDFPAMSPFQASCATNGSGECTPDAFVAELNPTGSLVYSSFLGGTGTDAGNAIALDAAGDIYVAGVTTSTNFPLPQPIATAPGGNGDGFIAELAPGGAELKWATYVGGSGPDQVNALAVDGNGYIYVTGATSSTNFPTQNAYQSACLLNSDNACAGEAFVAKYAPGGASVVYSTYLGGNNGDAGNAIAVDRSGSAYIAGVTQSSDFPTVNPLQTFKGTSDAFVTKLSANGTALVYSTYLGGTGVNSAAAIAINQLGVAVVAGATNAADFPTAAPVQAACATNSEGACTQDAFVTSLSPMGDQWNFSTYLGGTGTDQALALALDSQGDAFIAGSTSSTDFPSAKPAAPSTAQPGGGASTGAFVAEITGVASNQPQQSCTGTISWTGDAGTTAWGTANNWSPARVPVSTDNVCIGSSFASTTITIGTLSSSNQTINGLVSSASIDFTGGPLTITGAATFAGAVVVGTVPTSLSLSSGTLTLNGDSTVSAAMTQSGGTLAGTGSLTIAGLLSWSGGQMCTATTCSAPTGSEGVTNAQGGISLTGDDFVYGRVFNNAGTATDSGGSLYEEDGSVVNNLAGATWDFTGTATVNLYTGAANAFNNAGTLEETSTSTTSISDSGVTGSDGTFNNTGTVEASKTILTIGGDGGAGSGSWTVAAGATLAFDGQGSGAFALSGPVSGAGTVNFYDGAANLTGSYNVTGATQVNGGTTVNFLSGASVASVGNVTISGGALIFSTGNPITAASVTQSSGYLAGTDPLTITGALTWSGGFMCTAYSNSTCTTPASNATTNAQGGIIFSSSIFLLSRTLNNAGTASTATGSLQLEDGAIINNLAAATWDFTGDGAVALYTGAANTFNNAGTFEKTGGTAGVGSSGITDTDGTFNNTGTVTAGSGALTIGGGGSGNGSWSVSAGATLAFEAGSSATFALSGPVSGAGTVTFYTGDETLTGAYGVTGATVVDGGTVSFASGAAVTSLGTITLSSGSLNFSTGNPIAAAAITESNGILAGTDPLTITGALTWSGGFMCTAVSSGSCTTPASNATTNAEGGISFTGTGFLTGRTLNNSGTATLSGSSGTGLELSDGAVVNNLAGATWDFASDTFTNLYTGAANTFNNAGTLEKTGGTATSVGSSGITGNVGTFTNTGQVQADAAMLTLPNSYVQTAGGIGLDGGSIGSQATSSPGVSIQGGSISGSGAITGDITNSGGVLTPGTSTTPGTLQISNSSGTQYAQGAGGAYDVKVGGASAGQFDQTLVSGAVTLGGTLNVSLINGFTPSAGQSFLILQGGSVTGQFATVNLPSLPSGLTWTANYSTTAVTLIVNGAASVTLSTSGLSFPTQIVGTPSSASSVTLTNGGNEPLSITSISLAGADPGDFSLPISSSPCPISTATLAANASCVIAVVFDPTTAGSRSASVQIADNASNSPQQITLAGTAIQLTSIAVSPASTSLAVGNNLQYTAEGTYSDNSVRNITDSVTWTSSNTAVATISATGVATPVAAGGPITITASESGISGTASLTVTAPTLVSISVTPSNPSVSKGSPEQFTATGTYSDSSTKTLTGSVTWSSSNTTVATIASGGLASTLATGTTTIAATSGSVSGSTTLTVTAAALASIAVTPANSTIAAGATQQFTATGTYTDNSTTNLTSSVTWSSSNTSAATITSSGLATGVTAGQSTAISATYSGITGSTTLNIAAPTLVSIAVTPANSSVPAGETQQFTATGTYSDNSTKNLTSSVTWSSSNTAAATINASGLATGVAAGQSATITATSGTISGSTTLNVTAPALVSIAVTPATASVAAGETQQFTATGTYSDNSTQNITGSVTWTSSNPTAATITTAGLAKGVTSGLQTTISATSGTISGSATLSVTQAIVTAIAVSPVTASVAAGQTEQFTATGTFSDGNQQTLTSATWSSSNTAVATVSTTGLATGVQAGVPVTITASYSGVTGTASLTVTAAAEASLLPASLTFSGQAVGTTSAAQTVTLANPGGTALAITGISVSGQYTQTNTCGTGLAMGSSCTISVVFAPTSVGSQTGTLAVVDAFGTQTAEMTGTGVPAQADLVATLAGVTAGANGGYIVSITVTNEGSAAASGTAVTSGALLAEQNGTIVTTRTVTSPLPEPGTIAPGGSTTITLAFPASAGAAGSVGVAEVSLSFSGGSATASLRLTLPTS